MSKADSYKFFLDQIEQQENVLVSSLMYHVPPMEAELRESYRMGQLHLLRLVMSQAQGYDVNGSLKAMVSIEQLAEMLELITERAS
jgi:hypothetical protein